MAFKFIKSANDIQGAVLLEEGFYLMRIVSEPEILPNRKKKDGMSEEDGAGDNLVLKLRIQSDDPVENGRAFTKYLPMPKESDANDYDRFTGQPALDKKMERIVAWVEAFGGTVDEDEFDLASGAEAYVWVCQRAGQGEGAGLINDLDFESLPKPV
jgi:hypothetical protein